MKAYTPVPYMVPDRVMAETEQGKQDKKPRYRIALDAAIAEEKAEVLAQETVGELQTRMKKENDNAQKKYNALLARSTAAISGCQSPSVRVADCPPVDVPPLLIEKMDTL